MFIRWLATVTLAVSATWPIALSSSTAYVSVDNSGIYLAVPGVSFVQVQKLNSSGDVLWSTQVQASSSNLLYTSLFAMPHDLHLLTSVKQNVNGQNTGSSGSACVMSFSKSNGSFSVLIRPSSASGIQYVNGFAGNYLYVVGTKLSFGGSTYYDSFRLLSNGTVDAMPLVSYASSYTLAASIVSSSEGQTYFVSQVTGYTAYGQMFFNNKSYATITSRLTSQLQGVNNRFFAMDDGIGFWYSTGNGNAMTFYLFSDNLQLLINQTTYASPLGGSSLMFDYQGDLMAFAGKVSTYGRLVMYNVASGQLVQNITVSSLPTAFGVDFDMKRMYYAANSLLDYESFGSPTSTSTSTSTQTSTLSSTQTSTTRSLSTQSSLAKSTTSTSFKSTSTKSMSTPFTTSQSITTSSLTSAMVTSQLSMAQTTGTTDELSSTVDIKSSTTSQIGTKIEQADIVLTFVAQTLYASATQESIMASKTAGSTVQIQALNVVLYLELGAALVAALVLCCCCAYAFKKGKKRRQPATYISDQQPGTAYGQTTSYSQSHNTSMANNTTMQTAVNTDRALSVPGYRLMTRDVDYSCDQQINEGGFATVYEGTLLTSDAILKGNGQKKCAIKLIKTVDDAPQAIIDEDEAAFVQEVSMLSFFNDNKNFVNLIGFSQAPNAIVMKYYQFGTVEDILKGKSEVQFQFDLMFHLLTDVTGALTQMHMNGFLHCDIKPANIMLDKLGGKFIAVVSDLGLAQVVGTSALMVSAFKVSTLKGASFHYCSPELLMVYKNPKQKVPTMPMDVILKQDVYSTAIMAYEMITRKSAWNTKTEAKLIDLILNGERPATLDVVRDSKIPLIMEQLVKAWDAAPEKRPAMRDLDMMLRAIIDPLIQDGSFRMVKVD